MPSVCFEGFSKKQFEWNSLDYVLWSCWKLIYFQEISNLKIKDITRRYEIQTKVSKWSEEKSGDIQENLLEEVET